MCRIDELELVIRRKDGKVVAGIPELKLYAKADDIQAAVTALERKRAAFIADLSEMGALEDFGARASRVGRATEPTRGDLAQFTIKTLIVLGLIAGAFLLSTAWLVSMVEPSTALIASRIGRVVENTEEKLNRFVESMETKFQQNMKFGGVLSFGTRRSENSSGLPNRPTIFRLKRSANCSQTSTS
jgi:hypothetical protein